MKKFIYIFGAITFVLLDFGILFKVMHYPGGSPILLFTMGLLLPTLIIFTAVYLASRK